MTDRIDPKAIADELRSWSDTYWPREKRNDINPGFGNFGDNPTLARILDRAADTIDALVKERDEALANRDQFRNAWNAQGFEIIRLESERDALARERDMRASESADLERERDELAAVVDKVREEAEEWQAQSFSESAPVPGVGDLFLRIISTAPADALAEHDRQVAERAWDEGHLVHGADGWPREDGYCRISGGCIAVNPYYNRQE